MVCRLQTLLRLVPYLLARLNGFDWRCLELPFTRLWWLHFLLRLVHQPCSDNLRWRV